jgi:hypothetical protein
MWAGEWRSLTRPNGRVDLPRTTCSNLYPGLHLDCRKWQVSHAGIFRPTHAEVPCITNLNSVCTLDYSKIIARSWWRLARVKSAERSPYLRCSLAIEPGTYPLCGLWGQ